MKSKLKRTFVITLEKHLKERTPLIQVILGPRQVGKTTGVLMLSGLQGRVHYVTADDALNLSAEWITEQWQAAKLAHKSPVLIIDEVQKILHWSERIKSLWEGEKRQGGDLRLVLLGSSSLSLQQGLDDSLAGRFEVIPATHWTYEESRKQFGFTLDEYLILGGYPESARFRGDLPRWRAYLNSAIIETVIGKDILRQNTVKSPALFRQAFEVLSAYPAQEISYNKLLGQLQDRGNTDLIKHYLELYEAAFLFKSIPKYSGSVIRQKGSSPKIFPLCPALCATSLDSRGRVLEAAVGAELSKLPGKLHYWRGKAELDFVYVDGKDIIAIEVKSGRIRGGHGMNEFLKHFPKARPAFVTAENFPLFAAGPEKFFERIR